MECLNQLLRQRQAQRRRGQQQTGEQSQEQDPGTSQADGLVWLVNEN